MSCGRAQGGPISSMRLRVARPDHYLREQASSTSLRAEKFANSRLYLRRAC
jgi:hypothetical protein